MLTPSDLLSPSGPVELPLFPGEGDGTDGTALHTRLSSYITQAEAKSDSRVAQRAWALHLTFKAAYILAIARPADENTQVEILGSEGRDKDQRDGLLKQAEAYKKEFEDIVANTDGRSTPSHPISREVKTKYDY